MTLKLLSYETTCINPTLRWIAFLKLTFYVSFLIDFVLSITLRNLYMGTVQLK